MVRHFNNISAVEQTHQNILHEIKNIYDVNIMRMSFRGHNNVRVPKCPDDTLHS